MDVLAGPRQWAEQTFGSADLGDRRRTRRLVESAAAIAAHPQKPFTQIFDWNGLRGFYRLCDQAEATVEAVMAPHWDQIGTSPAEVARRRQEISPPSRARRGRFAAASENGEGRNRTGDTTIFRDRRAAQPDS